MAPNNKEERERVLARFVESVGHIVRWIATARKEPELVNGLVIEPVDERRMRYPACVKYMSHTVPHPETGKAQTAFNSPYKFGDEQDGRLALRVRLDAFNDSPEQLAARLLFGYATYANVVKATSETETATADGEKTTGNLRRLSIARNDGMPQTISANTFATYFGQYGLRLDVATANNGRQTVVGFKRPNDTDLANSPFIAELVKVCKEHNLRQLGIEYRANVNTMPKSASRSALVTLTCDNLNANCVSIRVKAEVAESAKVRCLSCQGLYRYVNPKVEKAQVAVEKAQSIMRKAQEQLRQAEKAAESEPEEQKKAA